MATANCFEQDGKQAGTVELPAGLFGSEVNGHLVQQAVAAHPATRRPGIRPRLTILSTSRRSRPNWVINSSIVMNSRDIKVASE